MRAEKQLLLDEIRDKVEGASTFLVTRYHSMNAQRTTEFRGKMRKVGGDFEVVRKRVLLKAAQAAGVELDENLLEGHIGIVFAGEDSVAATKVVFETGKETEGAISVLGGRFEGTMYSATDVERIAKLPDANTMRAQFLGLLEAPMAQTLAVMDALLTSILHLLENKRQASE